MLRGRTVLIRTALVAACSLWVHAPGARAQAEAAALPGEAAAPERTSSLLAFVEEVAAELEARAELEGVGGPVRLTVDGARGVDARRADREFGARLRRRLRDRGKLAPVARAPLRAAIVLSQEGGRVWAVGVLEGGRLPAPSTVAVSTPIDRELEVALGAGGARPGQSRWVKQRLGTVPAGVLDAVMLDVDGDLADDIALLSVDGVRLYRYASGDARPEMLGGPYALPGPRPWPRVRTGWMAETRDGKLWLATSAGHVALFDPRARTFSPVEQRGVPLRQPRVRTGVGRPLILLGGRFGSPDLVAPAMNADGDPILNANLPALVRDAIRYPGRDEVWVWVDSEGRLGGHVRPERPVLLPTPERAGDRVLLVDLDNDGQPELVSSAATPPGETDELTVWTVDATLRTLSVRYRTALSGGGVAAMAAGELDFDGNADVLLVEEGTSDVAVLWRVELQP